MVVEVLDMLNMVKSVEDFEEEANKPLNSKGEDDASDNLEKIADYQSYAKGLMNLALLSANASQLREATELCLPTRTVVISLLCLSIMFQLVASSLLVVERLTCKGEEYNKCHKYNVMIGVLCVVIIVVNLLVISIGGPKEECD